MTPEQQAIIDKTKAKMASAQLSPQQQAIIEKTKLKMGLTPEQQEAVAKTKAKLTINSLGASQAIESLQAAEDAGTSSVADTMQLNILKATPKFMEDGVNNFISSARKSKTDLDQLSGAMADEFSEYSPSESTIRAFSAMHGGDPSVALQGVTSGQMQDADYGKGYSTADKETRRKMRTKAYDAQTANINDTFDPNAKASTVGGIVGSMASPTTLAPLGHGYKAAAAGGGIIGGGMEALSQIEQDDEDFKKDRIAVSSIVGATLGVALEGVVQGVVKGVEWYRDRGMKMPVEDVAKTVTVNGIDLNNQPVDVVGMTKNINRYIDENPAPGPVVADVRFNDNMDGKTELDASILELDLRTDVDPTWNWNQSMTKPDTINVSTGPIQPARGLATPVVKAPAPEAPAEVARKVGALENTLEDLKGKIKTTTNSEYKKRVTTQAKEISDEIKLLKNPPKPVDPKRTLDKNKTKKLTERKKEAVLKTPVDLTDNGYMSPKKVESITKDLEKDIKAEQRTPYGRRATDRPGGRRTEDTPEAKRFSETWQGPRRPTPEKDYPFPERTQNLETSLGLDRPKDTSRKLIQDFDKATPALDEQLRTEYAPRVQAAQERLQGIKERRKANTSLEQQNGVESVLEASNELLKETPLVLQYRKDIAALTQDPLAQTIPDTTIAKYTNSLFKNPVIDKAVAQAEAIKDLDIPLNSEAGKAMHPAIGLSSTPNKPENAILAAYRFISRVHKSPLLRLRQFGKAGELGAQMIENAQADFTRIRDGKLTGVLQEFSKRKMSLKGKDGDIVQDLLDGKADKVLGQATAQHVELAKYVRENVYNWMAKEARDSGKWTPEQYNTYMKNPNYFNRSYDFDLLRTPEGRKSFVEDLSSLEAMDEKSAMDIIGSIITDDSNLIKTSRQMLTKMDNGKYKINTALAEVLFNKLGSRGVVGRATNLDFTRKLPPALDPILDKYRKQGLGPNLIAYLNHNYLDVILAKKFGANDKYAQVITQKIKEQTGSNDAGEYFKQVFFDVARDPRSENLKKFLALSNGQRWAIQKINTTMVASLYKASVLNISQGPSNGAMFLSGLDYGSPLANMFKPIQHTLEGVSRGWRSKLGTNALNEEYMRTGSAFETTLLELLGDAYGHSHKMYNTRGPGSSLNPLEWINDPARFLKMTGFNFSEDVNRRVATNMGTAYAEGAIARRDKLARFKTPTASQQIDLDRANKALVEIGLDPTKTEYTVDDMRGVANYFNNQINFQTSAGHAPMWMKTPSGAILGKFKDFVFKQTNFLEQRVIKPLVTKGDARPLAAFAVAAGVVGAPLDALGNILRGDDTDYTMTQRWARGVAVLGSFAAYGLYLGLFTGDVRETTKAIAGPVITKGLTLATSIPQGVKPATAAMLETFAPIVKISPQGRDFIKDLKKPEKKSPYAPADSQQLDMWDMALGKQQKKKKGPYEANY